MWNPIGGSGYLGIVEQHRVVQERLGRDATNVEAGASELATLLDARCLQAELSRLDSRDVAARTATDDDQVVVTSFRGHCSGTSKTGRGHSCGRSKCRTEHHHDSARTAERKRERTRERERTKNRKPTVFVLVQRGGGGYNMIRLVVDGGTEEQ